MAPTRKETQDEPYKEYDIYMTPDMNPARPYLLQFPTRSRKNPYNTDLQLSPGELRLKSDAGFVEVDVPFPTYYRGNRHRADEWGQAMDRVEREGANGFGVASGLTGMQGMSGRNRAGQRPEPAGEVQIASERMKQMSLGGQVYSQAKSDPHYLVAVFQNNEIHLTPMANTVQIRPQFHHVDAKTMADRIKARSASVSGAEANARAMEPRYVTMTRKSNVNDNEDQAAVSAKELLQKAHDEPWTRMKYVDDLADSAFAMYNDNLVLEEAENTSVLTTEIKDSDYLELAVPAVHATTKESKRGTVELSSDESDDDADATT